MLNNTEGLMKKLIICCLLLVWSLGLTNINLYAQHPKLQFDRVLEIGSILIPDAFTQDADGFFLDRDARGRVA